MICIRPVTRSLNTPNSNLFVAERLPDVVLLTNILAGTSQKQQKYAQMATVDFFQETDIVLIAR